MAEKQPNGCEKRRHFENLRMKFRHLKTTDSLAHVVARVVSHDVV